MTTPQLDLRGTLVLLAALLAPACSSLGPTKVSPDQFSYNQAIGRASNEQMLLNLVRLRYREVPVFLAVSSVLTQYVYTGSANLAGSVGTLTGDNANSIGAGAGVRYLERPTITYSPLSGEEFAGQLMTPLPGDLMFSLMQSGWPAADMMAMGMGRLGVARNPLFKELHTETGQKRNREFRETVDLVVQIAARDGLEMLRGIGEGDPVESYLVFQRSADRETAKLIELLKRKLGLSPELWTFRVTRNVIERAEDDVTIRVRSLLDLMGYLSGGVEVPPAHFGKHTTEPTHMEQVARALVPLRIQSGPERPDTVFVSVHYLDQWFWIDPDDDQSKESFGLLTYLFLMMAPTPEGAGPLLTVPA